MERATIIRYTTQCVMVYYHAFMEMYTPFASALGNSNLTLCPLCCFVDGISVIKSPSLGKRSVLDLIFLLVYFWNLMYIFILVVLWMRGSSVVACE